jgi:hypothetical protein
VCFQRFMGDTEAANGNIRAQLAEFWAGKWAKKMG